MCQKLLGTSKKIAEFTNGREGPLQTGYFGPNTSDNNTNLFTQIEEVIRDPSLYDWEKTRMNWTLNWMLSNPDAVIHLEKSPPNVLRMDYLYDNFPNVKFILMVRNPYAVVEGTYRTLLRLLPTATLDQVLIHTIKTMEFQKSNILNSYDKLFFKYEDLVDNTAITVDKIQSYLGVDDIDYSKTFKVKTYNSPIVNMNDAQILRLGETPGMIETITNYFTQHEDIIKYWGYELI